MGVVGLGERENTGLTSGLQSMALNAIVLVVTVIIGFFIAYYIEYAMTSVGNFTASPWYTLYTSFVSMLQIFFWILPVILIVIAAALSIAYVKGLASG